jgi:hypothetical protein
MALTAPKNLERTRGGRRDCLPFDPAFLWPRGYRVYAGSPWGRALRRNHGQDSHKCKSPDGREMFPDIMEPGDTFDEIVLLDGLCPRDLQNHHHGSTLPFDIAIFRRMITKIRSFTHSVG